MLIKVITFKLPLLGAKMLIKIPRVAGDAIDDQIPYICPPPLWGLTLIGALFLD
jgi:hypothetical protein